MCWPSASLLQQYAKALKNAKVFLKNFLSARFFEWKYSYLSIYVFLVKKFLTLLVAGRNYLR